MLKFLIYLDYIFCYTFCIFIIFGPFVTRNEKQGHHDGIVKKEAEQNKKYNESSTVARNALASVNNRRKTSMLA